MKVNILSCKKQTLLFFIAYHSIGLKAISHFIPTVIAMNAANHLHTMSLSIYTKTNRRTPSKGDHLICPWNYDIIVTNSRR